jgi:hypothetical protein
MSIYVWVVMVGAALCNVLSVKPDTLVDQLDAFLIGKGSELSMELFGKFDLFLRKEIAKAAPKPHAPTQSHAVSSCSVGSFPVLICVAFMYLPATADGCSASNQIQRYSSASRGSSIQCYPRLGPGIPRSCPVAESKPG